MDRQGIDKRYKLNKTHFMITMKECERLIEKLKKHHQIKKQPHGAMRYFQRALPFMIETEIAPHTESGNETHEVYFYE